MEKLSQQELQAYLDSLDEGPLGYRKEHEWDASRRFSQMNKFNNPMKDPKIVKNRNIDYKARSKKIDYKALAQNRNYEKQQQSNEKRKKTVYVYTYPNFEYVGVYEGIQETGRQLGIQGYLISNVLNNSKLKSTKGYTFSFEKLLKQ